ncbi:heavy metal translocatin [Bimuria novae-zelandiae CBS 107.79]|uniref:Heavy metal translocatin n=1 Tax=Bimuria novae-zelandiae CBS 107.79 TaxID=1447943 RepID=A0A6A5VJD4_9PLEO|nr:heavy metal translocatin [Bimuria novae-zelandiae CBS 107.79]
MSCCGLSHRDTDSDVDEQDSDQPRRSIEPTGPSDTERITLTIGGLKCGCCGDGGISHALNQIPGVQNHYVNVILARAEFDLDVRRASVKRVMRILAAATGYTFEEYFQPDGQVLEIIVDDPMEIHNAGRPYGVEFITTNVRSSWTPRIFSERSKVAPIFSRTSTPNPMTSPKRPALTEAGATTREKPRSKLLQPQHAVHIYYNANRIGARQVLDYYEQWLDQEIHLAPPAPHPSLAVGTKQTKRAFLIFLLSALFTIPVVFFAWGPIDRKNLIYAHLSLAFASVVQIIALWEFFPDACRTLIHAHMFDMDSLIALSTTVAYVFSVISYAWERKGKPFDTGSFFETSTLLVSLILLGRVVSEFARTRAAKSVSFRSLQVDEAHLVVPSASANDPSTRLIDARLLQYGDRFKVLPETRVVTDGTVVHGGSEVDESMITGEALPVAKGIESPVHAGTNNGSGMLIVALTKLPHENSVSKIATLVENAELTKPRAQAIADRVAAWFVPAIIAIALSVFTIWILVERYHNHRDADHAAITAFTYAIATFVVSCPCAIGLAVPMVVLIASGVAARAGIIFRNPQKLETARCVTDVVFDKTGTLTTGQLTVNGSEKDVKRQLLGLLNGIKHPVSIAVYNWVCSNTEADHDTRPMDMTSVQSIPGEGIQGTTAEGNHLIRAGNPSWLGLDPASIPHSAAELNYTLLCVTVDNVHRATFLLQSGIRPSAAPTITALHKHGIRVHMLTGDHENAASSVARTLGIPDALTKPRLKPADKKSYVDALQADSRTVLFVGDGTNDAAALKAAAVGVHISPDASSDIAKSAADIVLLNQNLADVCTLLEISRAAYRRIVANFVWSFVYNLAAVLAASGALRRWRVEPKYAGLGELVSVVPVVVVAWSMRWRGYEGRHGG